MSFLEFASNGNTVWLSGKESHFPLWVIHRGDVVTNVLCVQTMYQILHKNEVQVVLGL